MKENNWSAVLSFLVVGLGQVLRGELLLGYIMFFVSMVLLLIMLKWLIIGGLLYFVWQIISVCDAYKPIWFRNIKKE